MLEQRDAVADQAVDDVAHRFAALHDRRRQHLHELARYAVVVRHRDHRERKLVDAGVGPGEAAVPREEGGQRVVLRDDDAGHDVAEHRRRLERLAQVHALRVQRVRGVVERHRDERLQDPADGLRERERRFAQRVELVGDRADRLGQDGPVEPFLVAEVVVDRRDVGVCGLADLARRRRGVALGREDAGGVGDQLLAGQRAAIGVAARPRRAPSASSRVVGPDFIVDEIVSC